MLELELKPLVRAASRAAPFAAALACTVVMGAPASAGVLDEVWVGGYAHNYNQAHGKEGGTAEVEFEVDTARPPILRFMGSPRIAFTAAFNTAGFTDFGGVALAWDHRIYRRLSWGLQLGMDVNDGNLSAPKGPAGDHLRATRVQVGTRVLFREAASLNYRINDRWEAGLHIIHNSNGELLSAHHVPNQALNELGVAVGYKLP
ncbi:MAG: acyloxyacyl hydrolase [Caulobacterales bacterium]